MIKDVLVIDDQDDWVRTISRLVDRYGYNSIGFSDFNKALSYINEKVNSVYACFVDMKPLEAIPEAKYLTREQIEILEMPEKIFYASQEKCQSENFYFISAHKSEHDIEVLERTGANFIDKNYLSKSIDEIFKLE